MAFMGILLVNLIFGILSGVFFLSAVCLAIGLIIREKYKLIAKILSYSKAEDHLSILAGG